MLAGPLHREFHNGLPAWSLHMGEEGKTIMCVQIQPSTRQRGFWLICPLMCLSDVYVKANFCISLLWFAANLQISFRGRKRNSQELLLHNHSWRTQGRAVDERFCRFLHQQKLECLWEGCWIRQHGVSSIMPCKKSLKELVTGMDTCTCQRSKFTKSLMLYRGTFSFGSNGSLDWPEPQLLRNSCPRAESRARRFQCVETNKSTSICLQVKPQYLGYKEQGDYFMRRHTKHCHLQRHV